MAVMDVGEWHFVQEVPFAYTNDLEGKHRRQAGMVSPWQA